LARILVVDDEDNILTLLGTILRLGGHEVLTANNEADGFALLRRQDVDLLVLDLRIGEFDGREFFRRARAMNYSGAIVIVSAYGALRAARELGADGAIEKPFEPSELMNEIDLILAHRRGETAQPDQGPSLFRLFLRPRLALA
jgi:DNA-binding response OmpR family regulator